MSIRPAWAGAVVVAAGVAGFASGVVRAGLEVDGLAGVLGAYVCASAGAAIKTERVTSAAKLSERISVSDVLRRAVAREENAVDGAKIRMMITPKLHAARRRSG
jgi:hypothetical protein